MAGQATLTSERIAQEQMRTTAGIKAAAAMNDIENKAADLKLAITRYQAVTGTTTTNFDNVITALKAAL